MLQPRIIPSLLIHEKGLVKSTKFKDYKYVGDPINAVKIFNEKEVDENLDMSEKSGILAEGTKLKESDISKNTSVGDRLKEFVSKGISYVICTDISKDGMLQGPSFELYETILNTVSPVNLIASGGISSIEEIPVLKEIGCEGVIIGKAIYENRISLKQLQKYI